jgi:rod shape-determining protein MreC
MVRRQTFTLLLVTCVGHILLVSAQVQSKSGLPVIQAASFSVFARVQGLMGGVADTAHGIWSHYFALRGAAIENEALRRQILDLEADLQRQRALAARTQSLEDSLALKQSQPAPMLAARVIAGNPSPSVMTIMIDRGTDDGVRLNMAVVAAHGVVGRVIAPVSRSAATVQLLVGRNAAAAVTFERSQAGGMVVGGFSQTALRTEYVPVLADVRVGEKVTTSGQDGIFPAGFPVGTVDEVTHPGSAADREITVRPAVDFSRIDMVLVVLTVPRAGGPS